MQSPCFVPSLSITGAHTGNGILLMPREMLSLTGGGVQIGIEGAPPVETLEEWDELSGQWRTL